MAWAIAAAIAAFLIYRFFNEPSHKAQSLCFSAMHARKRKNWDFAAKFYAESYQVAGKLKEPRRSKIQSQIEVQWGWVLHRQGRLPEAEEMLQRGLSRAAEHFAPNSEAMLQGYLLLGDVCADQGNDSDAEKFYRKAFAGDEANDSVAGMMFDLQRLGHCLILQERRKEAERVLDRAIALETQHASEHAVSQGWDPDQYVVTPLSLPTLHLCRKQYDDARRLYLSQIEHWGKQAKRPDNIDLGQLNVQLAIAEAAAGHLDEAVVAYQRAAAVFDGEWCPGHPKAEAARQAGSALRVEVGAVA